MKKVLALLVAVVFCTGTALAQGDLNVKVGFPLNHSYGEIGNNSLNTVQYDFALSADYMYPVTDIIKVGGGVEMSYRKAFAKVNRFENNQEILNLPVYASFEIKPFKSMEELFLKANVGYVVFSNYYTNSSAEVDDNEGGLYFSVGAGYELPIGIFFDVTYKSYSYSYEFKRGDKTEVTDGSVGFNIGYKFKL